MTTEFIILTKNESIIRKWDITLTWIEVEDLIEHTDTFIKFLDKSKLSYQIELSRWTFRGKEELLYRSMETIDELKDSFQGLLGTYKKYIVDYVEKENKEKK